MFLGHLVDILAQCATLCLTWMGREANWGLALYYSTVLSRKVLFSSLPSNKLISCKMVYEMHEGKQFSRPCLIFSSLVVRRTGPFWNDSSYSSTTEVAFSLNFNGLVSCCERSSKARPHYSKYQYFVQNRKSH